MRHDKHLVPTRTPTPAEIFRQKMDAIHAENEIDRLRQLEGTTRATPRAIPRAIPTAAPRGTPTAAPRGAPTAVPTVAPRADTGQAQPAPQRQQTIPTEPIPRSVLRGDPVSAQEAIGSIGPALLPIRGLLELLGTFDEAVVAPFANKGFVEFEEVGLPTLDRPFGIKVGRRGFFDFDNPEQQAKTEAQNLRNQEFTSGRMPFIDFVEQSNAQQEERSLLEQLAFGFGNPASLLPLNKIGGVARTAFKGFRRVPTQAARQGDAATRAMIESSIGPIERQAIERHGSVGNIQQRVDNISSGQAYIDEFRDMPGFNPKDPYAEFHIPDNAITEGARERLAIEKEQLSDLLGRIRREVSAPSTSPIAQTRQIAPDTEITASSDAISTIMGQAPDAPPFVVRQSDQIPDNIARDVLPENEIVETITEAGNTIISGKEGAVISSREGPLKWFGLPDRPLSKSRPQRLANMLASTLDSAYPGAGRVFRKGISFFGGGRAQTVPEINGIMADAADMVTRSSARAASEGVSLKAGMNDAFTINRDGLITNAKLLGVEDRLPNGITMKTLAARLPLYWHLLDNRQRKIMLEAREALSEPSTWVGKQDMPDGELIIPAADETTPWGFWLPSDVVEDTTRKGRNVPKASTDAKPDPLGSSPDEELVFKGYPGGDPGVKTQEEAIVGFTRAWEVGDPGVKGDVISGRIRYAHPADAISRTIEQWGVDASRNYQTDAFKAISTTPKQIAIRDNPELWSKIYDLRGQRTRLKSALKLERRQLAKLDDFFEKDYIYDDINEVFSVVDARIERGQFAGADGEQLRELLVATREYMTPLKRDWDKAVEEAGKDSAEFLNVGKSSERLGQRMFAFDKGDSIRDHLRRGNPNIAEKFIDDVDGFTSGARAGGDDSALGIQTWTFLINDPVRWVKTAKAHYAGFYDPITTGKYIRNSYDLPANRQVRIHGQDHLLPTHRELVTRGELSFVEGVASSTIERGVGSRSASLLTRPGNVRIPRTTLRVDINPLARLNNMWNVMGNRIRMDTVRDNIIEQLGQGRTIPDLWASGDMAGLGRAVSKETGFVDAPFAGTTGSRILFAAKWLSARLDVVATGVGGLRDPRILMEALPILGRHLPQATRLPLSQRQTAKRFWRYMEVATAMTFALNEFALQNPELAKKIGLEPNEDYWKPRINGRFNPNFMKFRWFGRDISMYGPYHSIYNMMHRLSFAAAEGAPTAAINVVRGFAGITAGTAVDVTDILMGEGDFRSRSDIGERAILKVAGLITDREFDTNELNPEMSKFTGEARTIQFAGRVLENFTTFGTEEIFESGEELSAGNTAEGMVGVGSEIIGMVSSPLSPRDIADRLARERNLPSMANAERYQQRILNNFPEVGLKREDFVSDVKQAKSKILYDEFDTEVERIVLDLDVNGNKVPGGIPRSTKVWSYENAEAKLYSQLPDFEKTYDDPFAALRDGEIVTYEDALDGWYSLRGVGRSISGTTGLPGGKQLYATRTDYLDAVSRKLGIDAANSVRRNTNLRVPPEEIMKAMNRRRQTLIKASIKARKDHLRSIGANPTLADNLRVLP